MLKLTSTKIDRFSSNKRIKYQITFWKLHLSTLNFANYAIWRFKKIIRSFYILFVAPNGKYNKRINKRELFYFKVEIKIKRILGISEFCNTNRSIKLSDL